MVVFYLPRVSNCSEKSPLLNIQSLVCLVAGGRRWACGAIVANGKRLAVSGGLEVLNFNNRTNDDRSKKD
jgi:hypothetical protein